MQNNVVNESIWADGCPENIKEESKLKIQELLALSVDHILKEYAIKQGFKVEQANANIQYLPNIVLKKDEKLYAIAVVPFLFPNYSCLKDEARIKMVETVKKYEATPLFAPIGFRSTDKDRAAAGLALKGDTFNIMFRGFLELTDEPHQKMDVPVEEFKFI